MSKFNVPLVDLKACFEEIKEPIEKKIHEVVSSGSYVKGSYLESFEEAFAKYIGTKYCIGVASGTDALHLSLLALGISKDDEVIIPATTFVAAAYAVLYLGAKPVFIDVDPKTYNLDVNLLEKSISKKTKAIIPTHLYGQSAEMDEINKIAKKFNLAVIEDSCQSHGAFFNNKKTGSIGDTGVFSFYPSKNLGAFGDGGAITTNSLRLAKSLKKLREYGATNKYEFEEIGINSRLDSLQAAILETKLKHLDNWNSKRRKIAKKYDQAFGNIQKILTPFVRSKMGHVYHLYVIRIPKRNALVKYLSGHGIHTGVHYPIPLHLQKSLEFLNYKKGDFPVTESISREIVSLPIYPQLTSAQQDYVIEKILGFFQ